MLARQSASPVTRPFARLPNRLPAHHTACLPQRKQTRRCQEHVVVKRATLSKAADEKHLVFPTNLRSASRARLARGNMSKKRGRKWVRQIARDYADWRAQREHKKRATCKQTQIELATQSSRNCTRRNSRGKTSVW